MCQAIESNSAYYGKCPAHRLSGKLDLWIGVGTLWSRQPEQKKENQ